MDRSLRDGGHHDGVRVEPNAGVVVPTHALYQENELKPDALPRASIYRPASRRIGFIFPVRMHPMTSERMCVELLLGFMEARRMADPPSRGTCGTRLRLVSSRRDHGHELSPRICFYQAVTHWDNSCSEER